MVDRLSHFLVGLIIGLTFNIPLALLVMKRQDWDREKSMGELAAHQSYCVVGTSIGAIILAAMAMWHLS